MAKESTAEGDGETTKKKRKASRACQSCQKAHLTCSDVRPCARCIKRGDECIEGAKKKARYLLTPEELAELAKEPPKPKRPRVSKAKEAAATAAAAVPSPPKPTSPASSSSTSAQPPPPSNSNQPHPQRNSINSSSDPSYLYPQYPNFLPAQNSTTAANFFPSTSAPSFDNNSIFSANSSSSQPSSNQRLLGMTQQQQQQSQQNFHSIPSHPQSSERMADEDEEDDDDASSDADASGTTDGVSMRVDPEASDAGTGMNESNGFGEDGSHSNLVNSHLHRLSFDNGQGSSSQNQLPSSLLPPLLGNANLLPFPSPSSYPSNILQSQNPAPRSSSSHISDSQPSNLAPPPPAIDPRIVSSNNGGPSTWTWEGAQVPPPWEGFHPGAGQNSNHSIIPVGLNGAFDVMMGGGRGAEEDSKGKGKEREREMEILVAKAYNYSDGYTRLLEFATERFGQLDTLRLVRSLAEFRPKMLTMSATQTPESLAFKEEAFQRSLNDLTTILLPLTGTPTAVWRRTGELVAVGQEFSILTEWPLSELLYVPKEKKDVARTGGGPAWQGKHIWEVLQQKSTVEYFEEFGKRAFDGTMGGGFKAHATLMTPQGRAVSCCASFTVRRDLFDLPSLIIGQFLPLL
ncbi:hypothetical protein BDY24DRAFT_396325 [Mrakia frigida]|uniref:Zn(II)2Cys6 transcription factor domain-containing protein n=1 Tax=Mrakia frigida TaxID=29902 RepID=UPI003FCC03EE